MEEIEKLRASSEPKERFIRFHWQNLNDKKGGGQGLGMRHGRCWWNFRNQRTVGLSWNLWSSFCMAEIDLDNEDVTLSAAFPPVALWLSFSSNWSLVHRLSPKCRISEMYGTPPRDPDYIVIDERTTGIRIHDGTIWINPWTKSNSWTKSDPWWQRGIALNVNPFEMRHMRHEVRTPTGSWDEFVGSWEHEQTPDRRETQIFPYRYILKSGEMQERTAKIYVERMAWRPRCFKWTKLFEKERTSISVTFSDEVGEKAGSWKGGCTGCGYEMLPRETAEQCLRRMERECKF